MAEWVDYREVKARVTFRQVFEHYALLDGAVEEGKGEIAICCPFDGGRSRTLKANDTKRGFKCFAPECDQHGNVIDFTAAMENLLFRDAALLLQKLFMKPPSTDQAEVVHEVVCSNPAPASAPTAHTAEVEEPNTAPARSTGYMAEVEARLRELLAAEDDHAYTALIKWVKEELLASYRRGVEKGKGGT